MNDAQQKLNKQIQDCADALSADSVLLITAVGQTIATQGDIPTGELIALGSLIAGYAAANQAISQLIGNECQLTRRICKDGACHR